MGEVEETGAGSHPLDRAAFLPGGASFIRAALQVNPFAYLAKTGKASLFSDEDSYNAATIDACKRVGVGLMGVTDHHCVSSSEGLIAAAREAGITVFPGFEAKTSEGVHILCLFDPSVELETLNRYLGHCGIHEQADEVGPGQLDTAGLLSAVHRWGGVAVAAHGVTDGGLLRVLSGQPRIRAWRSTDLLAIAIPRAIADLPQDIRGIVANKDPVYRREHPVAVVNAADVCGPEDLEAPGTWCWIKMSSVTIDGLRQAFLDPGSRIRLTSDATPDQHTELVAIAWEGGFLDGTALHLNENLNVLIGGRGAGKSTVIESIRFALGIEPLGDSARKAHQGFVEKVLKPGTRVLLRIRSPRPSPRTYLIERTVSTQPIVRDDQGVKLNLSPADVMPHIEIYGQHEVAELAWHPERRGQLLERFITRDPSTPARVAEARRGIAQARRRIVEIDRELADVKEQLDSLPRLLEELARYEEAGLGEQLKQQGFFEKESALLTAATGRLEPFRAAIKSLRASMPVDHAFLTADSADESTSIDLLQRADGVFEGLDRELDAAVTHLEAVLGKAESELNAVRVAWEERRETAQVDYQRILRALQGSGVDGQQFVRTKGRVEELNLLAIRHAELSRLRVEQEGVRRTYFGQWREIHEEAFRLLVAAARQVSRRLRDQVRVTVTFEGDREPLIGFLNREIGGRLDRVRAQLREIPNLVLDDLANACREGAAALEERFGVGGAQADRLARVDESVLMELEELDLGPTVQIELNIASAGLASVWRPLEELSTGQKATALLMLLLLQSSDPLVIDQPEDDLDNSFITDGIVPRIRDEKRQRQFLISTHNANIPVLGDAEQIVVLRAHGEADGGGRGAIDPEEVGSIDAPRVRDLVEELLEGGRIAFEIRQRKYRF